MQQSPEGVRLQSLLAEMRVDLRVAASDGARIPATGPVVVIANHPYGVLDGAILTVLLTRVRPDVKVLTNFLLADVPELQKHCIFVDPFQTDRSVDVKPACSARSSSLAPERWHAGNVSLGRGIALANASGSGCRSRME